LLLAVTVTIAGGAIGLYRSQLFEIRSVDVIGAERLTPAAVRSRAEVPEGATLLRFPAGAIKERLLSYAWIEDAQVTRDFPHALRIRIVERKPLAIVDTGDTFWVVDSTGMVLGEQSLEETTTMPILRDIPALELSSGQAAESEVLSNALNILSGISAELRQKVRAISAPSVAETTLLTTDSVEVIIGEAVELEKKDVIVLKIMREQAGNVVTIDVRSTDRPVSRGLGE
jgi:cell division protein FtsQ